MGSESTGAHRWSWEWKSTLEIPSWWWRGNGKSALRNYYENDRYYRQFPGDRLAPVSTVLIPLSFGYAIVRHGIFDATHFVRRSLVLTATVGLLLVAYSVVYLILRELLSAPLSISTLGISFLSMLAVGLLFLLLQGRVRTLFQGGTPGGASFVEWNGRDDSGGRVAAGVYFVTLRVDGELRDTERVVVAR